jgi:hypothetical protein
MPAAEPGVLRRRQKALVAAVREAVNVGSALPDEAPLRMIVTAGFVRRYFKMMLDDPEWRAIIAETPAAGHPVMGHTAAHDLDQRALLALVAQIKTAARVGADLPDGATMRLFLSAGDCRRLYAAMVEHPEWEHMALDSPTAEPPPGGEPYLVRMLTLRTALLGIRDYARLAVDETAGPAHDFLREIQGMAEQGLRENP